MAVQINDVPTVINYTKLTNKIFQTLPVGIDSKLLGTFPKQIKEVSIPKPPKNYEAYFYRFTNLDTMKVYVGIHKGEIKDQYWHSSSCEEFNQDISNPSANFKFEILRFGKYDILTVDEHNMLKNDDAGNNPNYYNKRSGGSPKYKRTNLVECEKLVKDIISDKFKTKVSESVSDLIKFVHEERFFQVRIEFNQDKISTIANRIDDAIGNTELCQIVILVDRDGRDILLDGNHTVRGLDKSKHGKHSFTHRIPKEIHEKFSNQELINIASKLNPQIELDKTPQLPIDMVEKVLMGEINNGVDIDDELLFDICIFNEYTKKESKAILSKLRKKIAKDEHHRLTGKTVIDYSIAPHKQLLQAKIEDTKNSTTMCLVKTSGMWKSDDWQDLVYANKDNPKKMNLVVLVTHPAPTMAIDYYENWENGVRSAQRKKMLFWLNGLEKNGKKYKLRFVDMPYDESNEL